MAVPQQGTGRLGVCVLLCLFLAPALPRLAAQPPPPAGNQSNWVVEVVDANYAGRENSIAVDSSDRPHIAYLRSTGGGLPLWVEYATKASGSWRVQTLEATNVTWGGPSIAIDSLGRPWIAYPTGDSANTRVDLRLAHWNGSAWAFQTVQPFGVEAGWWPSLVLDRLDRPRIAYYSNVTGWLRLQYAAWNDTSWQYKVVFNSSELGTSRLPTWRPISLKLDSLGRPHIAEAGNGTLTFFSWDGAKWQADFPAPVPTGGAESVSLALDSRDQAHIAYYEDTAANPRYVHWNGTTWVRETPISFGSVGWGLSLVLDRSDEPRISYGHGLVLNPPPYYAYYVSKTAGVWGNPETVDPIERALETSLALDSHELPRMSYGMALNSTCCELRYAYVPWVDTSPPVSQVLPISPYWNGNPVTAAATDDSGVANVTLWYRYAADNASWGSWTSFGTLTNPPWQWAFPYPAGDGYYGFFSTAVDTAGNTEPPPTGPDAIAGYDGTPPVSSASAIVPYWHATSPLSVDATVTDNLSGVASVTLWYAYAPDNATWGPWTSSGTLAAPPWSWSFPFPDGEGNYRFHTIARDVAGNVEANKTSAEAIAGYRVLPDYTLSNPSPPGAITAGLSVPVTFRIGVANLGGDANATSVLAFVNESTPSSPFATFPVPALAAGATAGPFAATWTSPAVPGTYRVLALADFADTVQESNESNNAYAWTVTAVPGPATSLVIGQPNYTASVPFVTSATPLSFSVLDQGGTGIRSSRYRVDGGGWTDYTAPFALPREGEHIVQWYSEDNAGNVEATESATLRVDNTPPAPVVGIGDPKYAGARTYVTSATPISLAATDGGAIPVGLATIEYRIGGGAWTPYAAQFHGTPPDGPVRIEYAATDHLGNRANGTLEVVLDDTPPQTAISPSAGPYTPDTVFTLTATDAGSGVARTDVRVDDGAWSAYGGGFSLSVGDHVIRFRSVDRLNNTEAEHGFAVTVATSPPSVTVNWKPLVAAVFAAVLVLAGAWSANRVPGPFGTRRRRLLAFLLVALPFVAAEAATGLISLLTGLLTIPPVLGVGTAVDVGILAAGVAVSLYRVRPPKPET